MKRFLHNPLLLFYTPLRWFFVQFGHYPIINKIGRLLYRLAQAMAIFLLRLEPGIVAIYRMTSFNDLFCPGKSDIDMCVVVKDLGPYEDLAFMKRYNRIKTFVRFIFPFIKDFRLIYKSMFPSFEEIYADRLAKMGKHFTDWTLLAGQEQRSIFSAQPTRPNYFLRLAYDEIVQEVYKLLLDGHADCRLIYKSMRFLRYSIPILGGNCEAEEDFLLRLETWHKRSFCNDTALSIECLYYSLRWLATLPEKALSDSLPHTVIAPSSVSEIPLHLQSFAQHIAAAHHSIIFVPNRYSPSYVAYIPTTLTTIADFAKLLQDIVTALLASGYHKGIGNWVNPYRENRLFIVPITPKLFNVPAFFMHHVTFPEQLLASYRVPLHIDREIIDLNYASMPFIMCLSLQDLWRHNYSGFRHALYLFMDYRLFKEKDIICLDDIYKEYKKHFTNDPLVMTKDEVYLFGRDLLRQYGR